MRIAFIGVSHWHAPMYYQPAARLAGIHVVAVSDPNALIAERVGRELEATPFADYRDLIADARPDFVFAFGRHCDMPDTASALIEEGVPFLLEKPGGLNYEQVASIRDRSKARGLHVGTGFNFRVSEMYRRIRDVIAEDAVTHASFRYIGGGPYRYRESGCAWMLDPKLSGGGSAINLGIHFVDLFRAFTRCEPTQVTSLMGNATWGLPIEDYASIILRSDTSVCTVETGYTYPAKMGVFDLRFSVRTTRHYVVARSDDVVEIHRTCDGHMESFSTPTSNAYWYPVFVTESLDRFRRGQAPVADVADLAEAMKVIDAAYASSRGGGCKVEIQEHS
jgi:predicted dehydrogenase